MMHSDVIKWVQISKGLTVVTSGNSSVVTDADSQSMYDSTYNKNNIRIALPSQSVNIK